jgi:outer membrane lipoprotein LolB
MTALATRLAGAALVLALGACSGQPQLPPPLPPPDAPQLDEQTRWEQRLERLAALQDWRIRGKVGYRLPEDAGSASLDWRQAGERSDLRLSGPLGTGSTQITNEGALLRVHRDGIARLYPADAAPWLPDGTLLPVPIDSIRHWLRGIPDPAQPLDALVTVNALAEGFQQVGWVVRIEDYRDEQGIALPSRLTLEAPAAELHLRLILREWEIAR